MAAGRPTDYRDDFVMQAQKLAHLGATDMEIADFFEVNVKTIYQWKHTHPKFGNALKVGKETADDRVKRSLYMRAIGFEYDAVKVAFDKEGYPLYAPYREYVVPDTTAAIFWLKNRLPNEFRDRKELTGVDGGPIAITARELADEELAKIMEVAVGHNVSS